MSRPSRNIQSICHRIDISRDATECVALSSFLIEQILKTSTTHANIQELPQEGDIESVLVTYCGVTNYPKTWQLKTKFF